MGNKKLQEKKKKRRERESKAKVLARRELLRKKKKYDKEIDKDVKENTKRVEPYINPEKRKIRSQKQIEHNMEILKKLEEEHEISKAKRRQINKQLESEGHLTLQEKLQAIGDSAQKLSNEGKINLTSAD